MARAAKAGIKAVPTGIDHGTVTLVAGGAPFEVTTLRCDVETFGRHARIAYTTNWEEDAKRRDFTLNALYADRDGRLFDPLGGLADLVAGRVRFIGDAEERIKEDYLRILRFFRFNAYYGKGPLDAQGLAAVVRLRDGARQAFRRAGGGGAAPHPHRPAGRARARGALRLWAAHGPARRRAAPCRFHAPRRHRGDARPRARTRLAARGAGRCSWRRMWRGSPHASGWPMSSRRCLALAAKMGARCAACRMRPRPRLRSIGSDPVAYAASILIAWVRSAAAGRRSGLARAARSARALAGAGLPRARRRHHRAPGRAQGCGDRQRLAPAGADVDRKRLCARSRATARSGQDAALVQHHPDETDERRRESERYRHERDL